MKKTSVISMLAVIAVVLAVLASFMRIRASERGMAHVVLPSAQVADDGSQSGDDGFGKDAPASVEITNDNALILLKSLARPAEYSADVTVTLYWNGGESSSPRRIWSKNNAVRISSSDGASTQNCIVAGDRTYIWEQGSTKYYQGATAEFSADSAAGVPTYETLAALDGGAVLDSGQAKFGNALCLWIKTADGDDMCEWYIDMESGLLMCMERSRDGVLTYRAETTLISEEAVDDARFRLPDGSTVTAQ